MPTSCCPWPYDPELLERCVRDARTARNRAYAPYSRFSVGAALLVDDGKSVLTGCNVENASFGLSICAERNAVGAMVAGGFRHPLAIAVMGEHGVPCFPCGACRQFLAEFNIDLLVVVEEGDDLAVFPLNALLPFPFFYDGKEAGHE